MSLQSKRKDGKGHWPKGRPRNPVPKVRGWRSADAFLSTLFAWVHDHYATSELARDMQVPTSTVWRWRHGVYYPTQADLDRLVAWYREHKQLKKGA